PSGFWAPFEALAQRLRTAAAGSSIAVYSLESPQVITVGESTDETIDTGTAAVHARRTLITLITPDAGPVDAQIWGDENGPLLRVSIPARGIEVARQDISSAAARRVVVSHPGDEQVRISANGFSLAGTLSKPPAAAARPQPSVVLVGGSGVTDRDATSF